jgi:nitroreductase
MSDIRCRREPEAKIDDMFLDRWSPRAFLPDPIPADQIQSLFEAARWAPSCFNEQPWLFKYATGDEARQRFIALLTEKNQKWAGKAPLLVFLLTRRVFKLTGKPNRHAAFDAGSAWVSLAFQARKLGLFVHAMAGFDEKRSYGVLGISEEEYEVMAAIAIGKIGDPAQLSEDFRSNEFPNDRKPPTEVSVAVL